jgi:hypothetical protein
MTSHDVVRDEARRNLIHNTQVINQLLQQRNKQRTPAIKQNDIVLVGVPRIDRASSDPLSLPCKVLAITNSGRFQLGCKFGVLQITYEASELHLCETRDFPELDDIPEKRISLREAALMQNQSNITSICCNCAGKCMTRICICKRNEISCGSNCHKRCINSNCENCENN